MTATSAITTGSKVRGSYMGVPFTGTVQNARVNTMNFNIFIANIALDAPINLPDRTESESVQVWVDTTTGRDTRYGNAVELAA